MKARAPYVWLGPRWYAWLEFGPNSRHDAFVAISWRVCDEFGGSLSNVLSSPEDWAKEYAELRIGSARLLLMRSELVGIGLGAAYCDVPLLLQIAALYGAERRGWRWLFYRLRQWVTERSRIA